MDRLLISAACWCCILVARACAVTVAPATQVKELNQRLRHKHITLELTDAALDYAVEQSFDHLCAAHAPACNLYVNLTRPVT